MQEPGLPRSRRRGRPWKDRAGSAACPPRPRWGGWDPTPANRAEERGEAKLGGLWAGTGPAGRQSTTRVRSPNALLHTAAQAGAAEAEEVTGSCALISVAHRQRHRWGLRAHHVLVHHRLVEQLGRQLLALVRQEVDEVGVCQLHHLLHAPASIRRVRLSPQQDRRWRQ